MIKATGLEASIGPNQVLRGIDVAVAGGQLVAVLGANGAGKTSLLRALSNLLPLNAGSIEFDGRDTRGRAVHELARSGLVHVPQGRQIIPQLSVEDNLTIGASSLDMKPEEMRAGIEREFNRFPVLRDRRAVMGGSLSGGEQQMLAVSRGLMMRPKLLMLDEPSLGLAPQIVRLILESLRKLAGEGLAVILVEQAAHLALAYCDSAMVLRNGTCVMSGAADSLRGSQAMVDSYLS